MDAGLNLFRLQVFVTVVDKGGFSAAADHLNLTQPSVSFHMKALERLLGAKLLLYHGRSLELTAEGQELYHTAQVMLQDAERLMLTIDQISEGRQGRLVLGASIAFEQASFFERVIGPYFRAHPDVHLVLRFGHSAALTESVLQREIDIAYVARWTLLPGIAYEPLHRCEFAFMVSPRHPLAGRKTVTAAEIDRAGIIAAPAASVESAVYASVFRRAGLQQYHIAIEIDGVQSRILAARAGLGVLTTYLPPYSGEEDVAGLYRLRLDVEPATTEFGLVTRVGRPWGRIMHDFAAWLREASGTGPVLRQADDEPVKPSR